MKTRAIVPDYVMIAKADSVKLECLFERITKWFFEQGELPRNVFNVTKYHDKVKIINATSENEGKYHCYGKDGGNTVMAATFVRVMGKKDH